MPSLVDITPGYLNAGAGRINAAGTVLVTGQLPGEETRSFIWTPGGGLTDLGTFGLGTFARGLGENNVVIGESRAADGTTQSAIFQFK